jgi:hypothetical protein
VITSIAGSDTRIHRTIHLSGAEQDLNAVARAAPGICNRRDSKRVEALTRASRDFPNLYDNEEKVNLLTA